MAHTLINLGYLDNAECPVDSIRKNRKFIEYKKEPIANYRNYLKKVLLYDDQNMAAASTATVVQNVPSTAVVQNAAFTTGMVQNLDPAMAVAVVQQLLQTEHGKRTLGMMLAGDNSGAVASVQGEDGSSEQEEGGTDQGPPKRHRTA